MTAMTRPTRPTRPGAPRVALLAALAAAVPNAEAQARWRDVGKLGDGSPVLVDQRAVRRAGDSVRATIRVRFAKPRKLGGGEVTSSRTALTFDCPRRYAAIRENVYFFDERANRVYQRTAPKVPGFAPVIGGSMTAVALDALCPKK